MFTFVSIIHVIVLRICHEIDCKDHLFNNIQSVN